VLGNGGLGSICLQRRSLGAVLTRVTALRRVRTRHPLVCAVSGRLVIRRVGAGDGVRRPEYQSQGPVHLSVGLTVSGALVASSWTLHRQA
jgi:hypothetical protein